MSVGTALATARSAAGLSLEQVADRTRIRRTVVAAIEKDDFSHCMGDVYARGHIRTIAQVVGADSAALLAEFDAQAGRSVDAGLLPDGDVDLVGRLGGPRRALNWSAVLVVALVAVAAIGGYRLMAGDADDAGAPSAVNRPVASASAASPRPSIRSSPAPRVTPPGAVAQAPRTGVSVSVAAASGASWVRATTMGGQTLFEGIVARGRTQQFTDRRGVRIIVGNAGAVTLVVNGKPVGSPGAKGQVASMSFGPGDPA